MEKNQQLWLVTIPNRGETPDSTLSTLQNGVSNCKIHRFEIPNLVVGTLDSLMALSDDLVKINTLVENVVRKVERQYNELVTTDHEPLRAVNETPVETFLRSFVWDYARYRHQGRQLPDLVSQIQSMVAKVDEELKKLSITYNEKVQSLSAIQRKKTTNLVTSDFEDFLPATIVTKYEFLNTEYLATMILVVSTNVEQEFLRIYETIGEDIASYGGADWGGSFNPPNLGKDDGNFGPKSNRGSVKGSPVVPKSAVKIYSENDVHLYTVTILKGQYEAGYYEGDEFVQGKFVNFVEPFKHACRDKRFTAREWVFDPAKAGGLEGQVDQAKWELQQTHTTILRWCRAHFGEVFSGWMHLKVVTAFVESVLRYGLPVDVLTVFVEPNMRREKQVQDNLSKTIARMRSDLVAEVGEDEDEKSENSSEVLPYVCLKFGVAGGSGN